jgi:hypothetical protein
MQCSILAASLVLWLIMAAFAEATEPARRAPAAKSAVPDAKAIRERWFAAGVLVGQLLDVQKDHVKFHFTYKVPVLNQEAAQAIQELQGQLLEAIQNQDVDEVARIGGEISQQQANLYVPEDRAEDIELALAPSLNVRKLRLPVIFDDKGRPHRYTPEELRDLKGKERLPGFKAEVEELTEGQTVRLHLVRKKEKGIAPVIAMIVILQDPPEAEGDR